MARAIRTGQTGSLAGFSAMDEKIDNVLAIGWNFKLPAREKCPFEHFV